jgi:hypothetical protein
MMVEDVDVVDVKAPQTLIEAGEEVFPRPEVTIGTRPHVPTGFGGDDELVSVRAEVLAEDPPEIDLCTSVRGSVVVGQIEVGDTQVESTPQDGTLSIKWSVVTEVLPQPKRHRR